MGFIRGRAADGLWMTLNGGVMQRTPEKPDANTDAKFTDVPIKSGGYGIIDVAWKVHCLTEVQCSMKTPTFEFR